VIHPGSTPVGNATLVVADVLTCNKHSPTCAARGVGLMLCAAAVFAAVCRPSCGGTPVGGTCTGGWQALVGWFELGLKLVPILGFKSGFHTPVSYRGRIGKVTCYAWGKFAAQDMVTSPIGVEARYSMCPCCCCCCCPQPPVSLSQAFGQQETTLTSSPVLHVSRMQATQREAVGTWPTLLAM
jgi:hypothetical protein